MLGYLFFVGDRRKTPLPYRSEPDVTEDWLRLRHEAALTPAEIEALLKSAQGLQLIRGRWVDVDARKLGAAVERFRSIEKLAARNGLTFAEAMRLVAGASFADGLEADSAEWAEISAGAWLAQTLRSLRQPEGLARVDPGAALQTRLRSYQQTGVRWLYLLTKLGLGACLADDMGLGKTIQTLESFDTGPSGVPHAFHQHDGLGGSDLLALLALADWSDDEGRCWPSIPSIARKIRLSPVQARRVVHRLIEDGYICVAAGKTGGGTSRRYQISLSRLPLSPARGVSPERGPPSLR